MHPPVAQLERVCTEDYEVPDSKLTIKKGTAVQIPVIGLHYDPEYFPDPYKFNPYRFCLEDKTDWLKYVHLPFGGGRRYCLGRYVL